MLHSMLNVNEFETVQDLRTMFVNSCFTVTSLSSLKWHFCPVILIISEDLLITAPIDGEGKKEVNNHVQLVLLHILSQPFHCANDLFVPIICFAELVNPCVHLGT